MTTSGGDEVGDGSPQPTVVLRVGRLDGESTRQAREVIRDLADRPSISLIVELVDLDDGHELTMFALLMQAHHRLNGNGGTVLAVHPPPRLAGNLTAAAIPVGEQLPVPRDAAETVTLGQISAAGDART